MKNSFHITKFLVVFILLVSFFYGYVGIVQTGGKIYSPFLDHYVNWINWLTYFIAHASGSIITLLGFHVRYIEPSTFYINNKGGVYIAFPCLGVGVMSFWFAFVTAHSLMFKQKLKWVSLGILLIMMLNIVRISLVALGSHFKWQPIVPIDHHTLFNIFSYCLVFMLMYFFVRLYKPSFYSTTTISTKSLSHTS